MTKFKPRIASTYSVTFSFDSVETLDVTGFVIQCQAESYKYSNMNISYQIGSYEADGTMKISSNSKKMLKNFLKDVEVIAKRKKVDIYY